MTNFRDLPSEIPIQLVIGTKVTARLRDPPSDGLYTGSIDAVDTSNNTYRVTFERHGLGTHSVPDYEVLSNEPIETITISSFHSKFRTRNNGFSPFPGDIKSPIFKPLCYKKDPLLSGSMVNQPMMFQTTTHGRLGRFPAKLIEKIVIVTKILNVKKNKVKQLKSMNSEAEKLDSFDQELPEDFERRYASILIDLEKLNTDLQLYLDDIQVYCQEIAPEPSVAAMLAPSHLREKCREEAKDIVDKQNSVSSGDKKACENPAILELITDLTALMLQIKSLADNDHNAYELQVLEGTVENIKRKLSPVNQKIFQSNVEVHMKQIEVGLTQTNAENLVIGPIGNI